MRRLLILLAPTVLLLMSLGIGLFTADLPFWRRAIDLPLTAGETYLPTVVFDSPDVDARSSQAGPGQPAFDAPAFDAPVLEAVSDRARAAGAIALLVSRGADAPWERYYIAHPVSRATALPADFFARPLVALAVGEAVAEGKIQSLDTPISQWLSEWEGDERGKVTLRQLLNETSGLETGVDSADVLGSRPFDDVLRLPDFATSRGVRLLLGNDFQRTALGFRLEHEPGGFFNLSPVNTQLAAIVVERATGVPYEEFVGGRLFRFGAVGRVEFQMDRRSGMPAAHCCLLANPHAIGAVADRLLPAMPEGESAGWAGEMRKGSRANPEFGLQIERLSELSPEVWQLGHQKGGAIWYIPSAGIRVTVLANRDTPTPVSIIDPLLASLRK